MRGTVYERLYARLAPCADPACDCSGCMLWTGCLNSRGYGVIGDNGKRHLVHRVAWSLDNGPVPDGLTIDHVHQRGCRHKACALVAHLEPVTQAENNRRSTPHRAYRPQHRSRPAFEFPDGYWQRFAEWAGPEEWADVEQAGFLELAQAELDRFKDACRRPATEAS